MKPRGIFLLDDWALERVYGAELVAAISERVDLVSPPLDAAKIRRNLELLRDVELIFASWGVPALDAELLAAAPKLRAVFLGAGSVKGPATDAFWARNIPIVSAYSVNAIPVAEYTLATVLFSLKHGWHFVTTTQRERRFVPKQREIPGVYGSKVGLISLGAIGLRVTSLLRAHDVDLRAYDPFFPPAQAAALGIQLVSLEEIFRSCDVVSLHAPLLPETHGMIIGRHFAAMKGGATFINTARGALVREEEMIEVLRVRPDLTAVLDVTWPEPPIPESPLFSLPNVMLTPHIAGAMDRECRRLGQLVLEELDRYLAGQPLKCAISREQTLRMA